MNLLHGTMGLPPNSFYNDFAMILWSNWDSLFLGLKKSAENLPERLWFGKPSFTNPPLLHIKPSLLLFSFAKKVWGWKNIPYKESEH